MTKWCVKLCVTKRCVKEGVSQMVCARWSVTKSCVRCVTKLCVKDRVSKMVQAPRQSQPSAVSARPATRNEGGCHQVPRLPRKTKVDVTKCRACHMK